MDADWLSWISSAARLEPLRKRIRRRHIIQETWEAIAANKKARTHDHSTDPVEMRSADMASAGLLQASSREKIVAAALTCEEKTTNEVATGQKMDAIHSSTQPRAVGPNTAPPQLHTYICPYCAKSVQSPVATGRVDHRRSKGCGKQFRVAMACSQAAHTRMHVQHAARWCTQHWLPAKFG